jgi:hypothetical protein
MEKIILAGKEITIRKLAAKDLENTQEFVDYLNSLVKEGAYIDV